MQNQNSQRFNNVLGSEYGLLLKSVPHYDRMQSQVGVAVAGRFATSSKKVIRVLEIGSGTGITTKVLLDCDPRLQIVGVDNEEKMLVQARANVEVWGATDRVDFVNNEIGRYLATIPDESFDVVVSCFVLHNLENTCREAVLKEIHRVLVPGGLFVNGDKYGYESAVLHDQIYREQIRRFDVYDTIGRSDYKEEWVKHYEVDNQPHITFVEEKAKEYLAKIGFREICMMYREMLEGVIVATKE